MNQEASKCQLRIQESETGEYNLTELFELAKNEQERIDAADFMSDKIEIREVQGKGRGIVAIQHIKKGTLLVASKAIVINSNKKDDKTETDTPSKDSFADETPACTLNLAKLIHMLESDPAMAKQVYALYAGPQFDRNKTVIDFTIDVARIEAILKFNKVRFFSNPTKNVMSQESDESMSGLWHILSYFNHSCYPVQAVTFTIADFVLVFASQDLTPNEEITINTLETTSAFEPLPIRNIHFTRLGFNCKCELCLLDENDPNLSARAELCLEKTLTFSQIDRIRSLYSPDHPAHLQHDLIRPLLKLQDGFYNDEPAKSAEIFMELHQLTKGIDEFASIACLISAAGIHKKLGEDEKMRECVALSFETNSIGDKAFFLHRFAHLIENNDLSSECGTTSQ